MDEPDPPIEPRSAGYVPFSCIAIVNSSARLAGKEAMLSLIAQALDAQLSQDLGPALRIVPPRVVFAPNPKHLPAGAAVMWFKDELDEPSALAYHTQDELGLISASVGVSVILDNGGTELDGPDSLSAAASHEAAEMSADPDVSFCVRTPDGYTYDYELCDWVQGDSYERQIGGQAVSLSNFVFREAFA